VYRRYGPPDVLSVEDVEKPVPKGDEVLVRVHTASINAADRVLLRGKPFIIRLGMGLSKPRHPVLGFDVAGRVEAVGRRVEAFRMGDDVFGASRFGGSAEYACVSEQTVVAKPPNVSFEQAAATPTAAYTALQAIGKKGRLRPGEKVLVEGASGGVGTFAVQLAKAFGAEVTAVRSTRNVEIARSIGADHARGKTVITIGPGLGQSPGFQTIRPMKDLSVNRSPVTRPSTPPPSALERPKPQRA